MVVDRLDEDVGGKGRVPFVLELAKGYSETFNGI